jgi:hypothetical protein
LKSAEKKEKRLTRQTVAAIRGVDIAEVSESYYSNLDTEITNAIKKRQEFELEELIKTVPEGAKIAGLRQERENLLDTVWLATSPQQVKQLWQKLSAILGDEETPLQKEAMTIQPSE